MNALLIDKCRNLRELNLTGLQSPNFTSMDLSFNSKLEIFRAGKSALTGVSFAPGSPLSVAVLPATLQTLELRYLNRLSNDNLTLEGTNGINRLVVDNCALIDWQKLLAACISVRYLRVTGIDMEGDYLFLSGLQKYGGVDENGANTSRCNLLGEYRLNIVIENEELESLKAYFDGLRIIMSLSAFINEIDNFNSEAYGGEPYYPEVTLDNVGEIMDYYNGESYEEYLERFAKDNMDINDLVNSY